MAFFKVFLLLLFSPLVATLRTRQIYEYPPGRSRSVENIAIRHNGELVYTTTSEPCLYTINPHVRNPKPVQVHCFENASVTLGIAEAFEDVFTFVVGNYTHLQSVPGSFSVWNVNFRPHWKKPRVDLVVRIPEAAALNGITAFTTSTILAADSTLGQVWKVDLDSGRYSIAMSNPHLLPNASLPIELNGIHFDHIASKAYIANSANGTFGVAEYHAATGTFSPFRVLAHAHPGGVFDDFALSRSRQVAYVTEHSNRVVSIDLRTGEKEVVVEGPGGSVGGFEPTSAVLSSDENVLYVGADRFTFPSGAETNGQIFEVDVCSDKRVHKWERIV
ncbi:hypothetical protein PRZ48_013796 [Zasmidium cellare]|uniref:Uncharacterized protein n=1 Tax=Zasmidium cellare TaxID=395010 RepID=A0ABR0E238_ZASCE|nr:hypothetical protein PRZ48_013796 [Zasmidium cellare]